MTSNTIPVKELVRDLKQQFTTATKGYPDAVRGNPTFKLECEFAWFVHEITIGPACMVYEQVNSCREFIRGIKPYAKA
jgi:hypothetical protein